MENDGKILFATSWAVKNFLINPGTVLDASPFGNHCVEIQFRAYPESSPPLGKRPPDWIFARCRVKPTRTQHNLLAELLSLISPSIDEEEIRGDGLNQERRRDRFQADLAKSESLRDFQDNIRQQLRDLMNQVSDATYKGAMDFLKLLRWRYVKDCNFYLHHRSSIFWQAPEDLGWRYIPSRPLASGPLRGIQVGISKHEYAIEEVNRLLQANQNPRIQYDLLCEARSLTTSMPHLSLIESVQALEIGAKDAVSRLCESATWLAFEAPTPPILKILEEYIPTLINDETVRGRFQAFITNCAKDIKKIINQRNNLSHKGTKLDSDAAEFACDLVGDLLYKLDFACGVVWADQAVWRRSEVMDRLQSRFTTSDNQSEKNKRK